MSIPERDRVLKEMEDAVREAQRQALLGELEQYCMQVEEPSTSQASRRRRPKKTEDVRWIKRDSDGNIIYANPRSSRKPAGTPRPKQSVIGVSESTAVETVVEVRSDFTAVTAEAFLEELHQSLAEDIEGDSPPCLRPPQASSDWMTRKRQLSEWWGKERPQLVNNMLARQHAAPRICQLCGNNPAVICCSDCRPQPYLCGQCDIRVHQRQVFHNRDLMTDTFFHPLPPTTCVLDSVLTHCERLVPLEMPDKVCNCLRSSVIAGQSIAVVTMNGRYDLRLPQIKCEACEASWSPELGDLIGSDSFRQSFLEWEAARYEVDTLTREDHFNCPACSPDMLAVSVDGNRKLYRFKTAARSEEKAIFDGVFIANDGDVQRFVDYIHTATNHVSGRGVCGGHWSAAREMSRKASGKTDEEGLELAVCRHGVLLRALNMFRGEIFAYPLYLQQQMASKAITFFAMDVACKYWPYLQKVAEKCPELQHLLDMRPFLSVFHAKAHDFMCEVKWSGAYQEGAGSTLGEEVEQCNAFLSRIAVTTKHMSKAGRTDMLTVMGMRWNQQKINHLSSTLTRRYQKTTVALEGQLQNLEAMKIQMGITDDQLESWVIDVKQWAGGTTSPTDGAVAAVASRIEDLVASVKRRSQFLYKDSDGSKQRARMRRKIREEKAILTSVVDKYNSMVEQEEQLNMDDILSKSIVWPWQLKHSDVVGLATKRKAFDAAMAVKRLEEEKRIIIAEMQKHWRDLCGRGATLDQISQLTVTGETLGLLEDGLKGLQSLVLKKKKARRTMEEHVKKMYMKILTDTGMNLSDHSDSEEEYGGSDSGQE
ncbi:hypothetical protein ACEWY4_001598 [Coilia grayii]|uniref:CxC3 like cysteine cluster domain-containing protein n=1 Tax=Coilia grayii TaxID=363190 RepID=A0ABD1KTC6_9TELE